MFKQPFTDILWAILRYSIWSVLFGLLLGLIFRFGNTYLRDLAFSSLLEQFAIQSTLLLGFVGFSVLSLRVALFGRIASITARGRFLQLGLLELLAVIASITCGITIGFLLFNLDKPGALYVLAMAIMAFITFVCVPSFGIAFSFRGVLTSRENVVRIGSAACFLLTIGFAIFRVAT